MVFTSQISFISVYYDDINQSFVLAAQYVYYVHSLFECVFQILQDIRSAQDPFPLFPGEVLKLGCTPLRIVMANSALRLRAVLDYEDESGEKRVAGDEWLFEGPGIMPVHLVLNFNKDVNNSCNNLIVLNFLCLN